MLSYFDIADTIANTTDITGLVRPSSSAERGRLLFIAGKDGREKFSPPNPRNPLKSLNSEELIQANENKF
jgi:hypothetical protein